jgi:predicted MPP superfamily phosphohydrolase
MKSDFELIVHRLPECKEAKLYFIGDLHAGAIEANIKGWESFCQRILEERNSYLCLLGDLMNNATRSSVSNVFEDTMRPREQKRYIANALAPLSERLLCAVSGNHEARSGKDSDDCDNCQNFHQRKIREFSFHKSNPFLLYFCCNITAECERVKSGIKKKDDPEKESS